MVRRAGVWQNFAIPLGLWTNTTNIFTSNLNSNLHNLTMRLIYNAATASYGTFPNIANQNVLIANVQLSLQTSVQGQQLGLQMNNVSVNSLSNGVGTVSQLGNWTGNSMLENFTAYNNSSYPFTISFTANFNLFINETTPQTDYATNTGSPGTQFVAVNGSSTNWAWYAYFSDPSGYTEYNFTIYCPSDWVFTWVSSPQLPNTNQLSACNTSIPGQLSVPIYTISTTPDGFWTFGAISSNYCLNLTTYSNTTATPGPTNWSQNSTFFTNNYLNVTGQIQTTGNFTNLAATNAVLDIEFPNGTLWLAAEQSVSVNANGNVRFLPFQIPTSGPNYIVGTYTIISYME